MNILEYYYEKIIKYDLLNKFFYSSLKSIPRLTKIVLNFGCKSFEFRALASSLLALELITQKSSSLRVSKRANIFLKIRKGHPVGCAVTLNSPHMYSFFFKLLTEVFPTSENFRGNLIRKPFEKTHVSLTLRSLVSFNELGKQFYLFSRLPFLNVTLVTSARTPQEALYLLKSFKLPIRQVD